ncbi:MULTISPECIES: hypothetical protein [Moorena]|uniref:hypothetical protein n=1 Tax=Moorena TaxID=1155738 RepID=UPI0002E59365|nr:MULTISPECIES: hypothetical protein [Moorena]NEQ12376.1 hypothetical protein [Moorena sp. SIO3E2]NES84773.1 hypothetical protein [Moorena sp. SIO2B7]NEP65499.1 hypothetical protein [Moorena sp. SIO3A5]NER85633.1 hypothetical protein [Moorena sp. SIO3A2]NES40425.1 hypothetical protein [Moorena sp. SIO2C4]
MAKRPRYAFNCSSFTLPYTGPLGKNNLGQKATLREQPNNLQPNNLQPSTLAKRPRYANNLQPWPKGHATRTTFNLQPSTI